MKFIKIFIFSLITIISIFSFFNLAQADFTVTSSMAEQIKGQIQVGAEYGAGMTGKADPRRMVENIITILLGLVGTIFMVYLVAGGYWYITSQGEEERQKKALKTIQATIIGLVIVLAAYSITIYVGSKVKEAVVLEIEATK
ncbi:MAG TPA: hypothetical protein DEB09_04540 [Candidatus Magasanikbacteria bacterium]|nr:hypothetical protein [Candidatus Magasanikbacteria bacterium]